ncbi:Hypothetical predicted protein, partial [Mytilus galloprovincialis]
VKILTYYYSTKKITIQTNGRCHADNWNNRLITNRMPADDCSYPYRRVGKDAILFKRIIFRPMMLLLNVYDEYYINKVKKETNQILVALRQNQITKHIKNEWTRTVIFLTCLIKFCYIYNDAVIIVKCIHYYFGGRNINRYKPGGDWRWIKKNGDMVKMIYFAFDTGEPNG